MIAIALWIQKVKTTMDALWGVTCLFCVPGVVVATIGLMVPSGGGGGGGGIGHKIYSFQIEDLIEKAPKSYAPEHGQGGFFAYQLGLFNSSGELVHAYPDQLTELNLDPQKGSIVIEIPHDTPSGEYSLRVFKNSAQPVRQVPLRVGD